MAVSIEIALHVTGDGDTEQSIRRHCTFTKADEYTAEYHELIAHLAMVCARSHWRQADVYRRLAHERDERIARADARRAAKEATT